MVREQCTLQRIRNDYRNRLISALDMSAAAANKPEGRKNVKLFDLFNDEPKVTVQKINQSHTVVTTTTIKKKDEQPKAEKKRQPDAKPKNLTITNNVELLAHLKALREYAMYMENFEAIVALHKLEKIFINAANDNEFQYEKTQVKLK
ncbi:uncharacterized protein LOC108598743 [Drosophila busckii]|uniref:uncharacterized protein LOC108598743 n=1 Tax=Drosophila busckii TaxID=30019 RepID=UPI00083EA35A|nr:uncharacterized protein LOC108598743 [Drosophila busckii]